MVLLIALPTLYTELTPSTRKGILLCITFSSIYLLMVIKGSKEERRRNHSYIAYSAVLLILLTFAFATNGLQGQLMWINHRDYPGGPYAYFLASTNSWFETLGTATDIVANVMADALLVSLIRIHTMLKHWINSG